MAIASRNDNSGADRPGWLLALVRAVNGMVARPYGYLALSNDARSKVGIDLGDTKQDR